LHEEQLDAAENARAVIFSHFTFLREKIDLWDEMTMLRVPFSVIEPADQFSGSLYGCYNIGNYKPNFVFCTFLIQL
jgi:hypothetical protein